MEVATSILVLVSQPCTVIGWVMPGKIVVLARELWQNLKILIAIPSMQVYFMFFLERRSEQLISLAAMLIIVF